MLPAVVVDIGNTRVKWGRCAADGIADVVALPPDPAAWAAQVAAWGLGRGTRWAVGGVNPPVADALAAWVESIGGTCHHFRSPTELPIPLLVDEPAAVGIDRVFGALAARSLVPPSTPAVTVDVGTAVTVNLVDAAGAFRGGAIFPGPRLMALALRDRTAQLPLVELTGSPEGLGPATNTAAAIRTGIESAVVGGVHGLICGALDAAPAPGAWVFITGGAATVLAPYHLRDVTMTREPALNLLGIRLAAAALG
ncbi:type III pantothenate kinase [Urbifossiella limnaea]|uniref:Type III pantothenate kinase n=1 Tax=Urbifossiella limnaea TaxID=2528023 RepID=A0A517XZM6_9BACT|nr:type III pantothenate kinase [Urbifossiella limnaea]QDU22965.1 Type III pantothenate kinase [Urbifossiella limnaea]